MFMSYMIFIFLFGCQSHTAAMQVICDAPKKCTECLKVLPEMQLMATAQYIDKRISNREAQKMMEDFAILSSKDKKELLETNAQKAGIQDCSFAAMIDK